MIKVINQRLADQLLKFRYIKQQFYPYLASNKNNQPGQKPNTISGFQKFNKFSKKNNDNNPNPNPDPDPNQNFQKSKIKVAPQSYRLYKRLKFQAGYIGHQAEIRILKHRYKRVFQKQPLPNLKINYSFMPGANFEQKEQEKKQENKESQEKTGFTLNSLAKPQILFLLLILQFVILQCLTLIQIIPYEELHPVLSEMCGENFDPRNELSIKNLSLQAKAKLAAFFGSIKEIRVYEQTLDNDRFFRLVVTLKQKGIRKFLLTDGNINTIKNLCFYLQKDLPSDEKVLFTFGQPSINYGKALSQAFQILSPFITIAIIFYLIRGSGHEKIMESLLGKKKNFKIEPSKNIQVKFKDVAGMEEAKKQITQFVDFLQKSQKYIQMGAKIPKGALLTGPPGTGKTMLAKACAGQAGVSFFYISGSQFVQMFVGLGASKVRDLFAKARKQAPSIIFIDQIDAIGKKRQNSRNEQKDATLNQLLVQMDGFSTSETVIVLAASNRKDSLDPALTRPGRFDRLIQIILPDIKARQQIFMVHLQKLKIDPNRQLSDIAKRLSELSTGYSGADIANLCNQAAIIAARNQRKYIIDKDFEDAAERITAGYEKKSLMTQKTKKRVALHQAGHAVTAWFLRGGDPLVKLTIIPRSKGALGYAQYLPKNSFIKTRDQLVDRVAIMLGGLTSQQIFYGNLSSGGSDDLQKVYRLTRQMITLYGMGKQTYNITLDQQSYVKKQSDFLTNKMDDQIQLLLEEGKNRAKNILTEKKQVVEKLASLLIQKQTINQAEILEVMGQRPTFLEEAIA